MYQVGSSLKCETGRWYGLTGSSLKCETGRWYGLTSSILFTALKNNEKYSIY
jgi:hypothetical protein